MSAAGSAACSAGRRASAARRRAGPKCATNGRSRQHRRRSSPTVAVAEPARSVATAGARRRTASRHPRSPSLALGDSYQLPTVDLLAPPPKETRQQIDRAGLERNARLLETVLEDFNVRGDIVEVRPGPVVTMYELEPASGIKASRVIALADDIARNMSALSARVATIPGRSVIGIELPNPKREMVSLSELIGSQAFEDQNMSLPLILGKNIAGDPVIADLAPMPHLLVAGTTGSGKSVGLNCMILSLLYRYGPDQCKLIMIDPKMLELSMYDDIPHLLAPVVTEPGKAIRALKWTVEQMEERYRMMANLGVRALPSFNAKVREAKAKGAKLGRRVQTGYDADTGQPLYETEQLEYEVLPQIVVIVDELADLMMTAGKEVEFLIQRLAQKARAAGIHLIMATQRPSVDVITGVIKANLPTRISFQVTSKIDSRTILGEQGAEQLLGQGRHALHARRQADHPRPRPVRQRRGSALGRRALAQAGRAGLRPGGHRGAGGRRLSVRRPADRRGRCRDPALPQGDPDRRREPEGLDLLPPAPAPRRLQQRRAADRADGEGRARRPARPRRPPRGADRPRRASDLSLSLNGTEPEGSERIQRANASLPATNPRSFGMTFDHKPCARPPARGDCSSRRRPRPRDSPDLARLKAI